MKIRAISSFNAMNLYLTYNDPCVSFQTIIGNIYIYIYTVNTKVTFQVFKQFLTRVSTSWIRNNYNYSFLDPKNINTVERVTPAN